MSLNEGILLLPSDQTMLRFTMRNNKQLLWKCVRASCVFNMKTHRYENTMLAQQRNNNKNTSQTYTFSLDRYYYRCVLFLL